MDFGFHETVPLESLVMCSPICDSFIHFLKDVSVTYLLAVLTWVLKGTLNEIYKAYLYDTDKKENQIFLIYRKFRRDRLQSHI